jgi:hypothetical protein
VNYAQRQVLRSVGTSAPGSVQSSGDADVYFLADSGIRSLKVRVATQNAMVSDVGFPVDRLIRALLATLTDAEKYAAVSCVEPLTNSYWLYIPGHAGAEGYVWVFSYHPESEIAAWSRYRCTYNTTGTIPPSAATYPAGLAVSFSELIIGNTYTWTPSTYETSFQCGSTTLTAAGSFTATAATARAFGTSGQSYTGTLTGTYRTVFVPSKFVVNNGRVYARAGDNIFLVGGSDGNTYDACGVQCDTPFLNFSTAGTRKALRGVDASFEGTWKVSLGTNLSNGDAVKPIYTNTDVSFSRGIALAAQQGTHAKVRLEETSSGYARFSQVLLHFDEGDEK